MYFKEELTPTQLRIWELLKSGKPCDSVTLGLAIDEDGLCEGYNVTMHIARLRKKLEPGYGILLQYKRRRKSYRFVQFVGDAYE